MDFQSLSRRELQALCKRNKIPANITNVAMANALGALPYVEGIEEFLNGEGSGVPETPMKEEAVSSEIPRTGLRTSTRRKTVKDESVTTRTRCAAAARCTEELENRDLNVALTTPSLPSSRRRTATASSACKKVDFQKVVDVDKDENDLDQEKNVTEKTPAIPKSQKRVAGASTRRRTETHNNGAAEQRVYSTRRSVRLLEKNMESLSLGEDVKTEPITIHMSFDEMLNSSGPVKEETELEIEPKKTDESESKLDEDLGLKIDDQEKNEMESEVKHSKDEPEIDTDDPLKRSAENSVTENNFDDFETKALDNNLDVKCFSEDEEANEVAKNNGAMGISAEHIYYSGKFSLPTKDVDLTVLHNTSITEESGVEVQSKQNKSIYELAEHIEELEVKVMNISAEELSLPHEIVEEETQVHDVLSSAEEFVMEVKDGQDEYADESEPATIEEEEALNADIEGDKQETEMEKVSVQAEEDDTIIKSMGSPAPENISENLVDDKIQWQREEAAPKDVNVDAPENISENLVDNKIQWQREEAAPKDVNVDAPENISENLVDDKIQWQREEAAPKDVNVDTPENISENLVDDKIQWPREEAAPKDVNVDAPENISENLVDDKIQWQREEAAPKDVNVDAPENISENLVDDKIQWQREEAAPKDVNVDAINSQRKISHDIQCEQALVEISVTSTKKIIPTSSNIIGVQSIPSFAADQLALASQFPRPTLVAMKSPLNDQAIRLLMDNSDAEEGENEKEQEREQCVQRTAVENNDPSLRQLRKMLKEQLQLRKKMDENKNTKVVGGGGK